MMKKFAKSILVSVIGWQVRRLRKKWDFKTIAVVGSIGKTSTKSAIATVLGVKYKVRYQKGNYNDIVSVPLVYFGKEMPSIFNILKWVNILVSNELQILRNYPYEIVVLELGIDEPGQMMEFARYVTSDLTVVTALTPEHMANFDNIKQVASEELSVSKFSNKLLVNRQLCPKELVGDMHCEYYGSNAGTNYSIYSIQAAEHVAKCLGMTQQEFDLGKELIKPMPGRMSILKGIDGTTIIDDTYNSSPDAVLAALGVLRNFESNQRIAILGSMNELGEVSMDAHSQVGKVCQPSWLDCVVTIGEQANMYIAPAAKENGCKVFEFANPKLAGEYVRGIIKSGAVILAKGSQNGVFAEEAIKELLADPKDSSKLVRQSNSWMKKKNRQFEFEGISTKYAE